MIKIENLCMTFHHEILKDINVEINKGDVISVIGPSGCGKSTFLRCINLLNTPTSGHIYLDGKEITNSSKKELSLLRQKMGMVFQSFNLFNHMTIIENIMLAPVELLGRDRQEVYEEAMDLLNQVGLAHKAFSYPEGMSGDQKQRAAIARTLAMHPDIILFDEPTSALDPSVTNEVLGVMKMLAEQGMTMLIVTHEMDFAENVSNRVFYMDEKGIYEDGSPEQIFHNPLKPKTKQFIYQIKCFNYQIDSNCFDYYDFLAKSTTFLKKHLFNQKRINETEVVLEEFIYNIFFKKYKNIKLDVTLSYAEKFDNLRIIFKSDCINQDILNDINDELTSNIINNLTREIEIMDKELDIKLLYNRP